jgi:hypothetical protein
MTRNVRYGRRLEKSRKIAFTLRDFVCMAEDVDGQERVSATCEEIIVNPDLVDLKDLCPALGQQLLEGCPWRDEGLRQSGGREA